MEGIMFSKEPIQAAFDRYVDQFDKATPGIASKQLHSHIVSQLCESLARSLGWSEHDIQLAWVMGLLHDIGRFEQAAGTIRSSITNPWTMPGSG